MDDFPAKRTRSQTSSTEDTGNVEDVILSPTRPSRSRIRSRIKKLNINPLSKNQSPCTPFKVDEGSSSRERHASRHHIRKGSVGGITRSLEKEIQTKLGDYNFKSNRTSQPVHKQITRKVLFVGNQKNPSAKTPGEIATLSLQSNNSCEMMPDFKGKDKSNHPIQGVNDQAIEVNALNTTNLGNGGSLQADICEANTPDNQMADNTPKDLSLSDVYAKLIEVLQTNQGVRSSIDALTQTVNNSAQKYEQLNTRLTKVEAEVETNSMSIAAIQKWEPRITAVEKMVQSPETVKVGNADCETQIDCIEQLKNKIDRLESIACIQDQKIMEMKDSIDNLQYHSMKSNVIIYGIKRLAKDEDCIGLATKFFREMMRLPEAIPLATAHRLGSSDTSPMIVKLINHNQKGLIFKNISNISKLKNIDGDFFRVTDQLPGERAELDRRRRDAVRDNSKLNPPQKLTLKTEKGILFREENEQWHQYSSQICCPTTAGVLSWNEQKAELMHKIQQKFIAGSLIMKGKCSFQGFSIEVANVADVNDAYEAIRALHLKARHIVCAFRLPGQKVVELEDGHDDGEFTAARILLNALKTADIYLDAFLLYAIMGGPTLGTIDFMAIYRQQDQLSFALQTIALHNRYSSHGKRLMMTGWPKASAGRQKRRDPDHTATEGTEDVVATATQRVAGGKRLVLVRRLKHGHPKLKATIQTR